MSNVPATPTVAMVIVDFGNTGVDPTTLPAMAAALTRQSTEHFALPPPYGYGIAATIRVASSPTDVQPEEWVIGLLEKPDVAGALGYHDQTPNGLPFIKVFPLLDAQDGAELSVTISHEVCEALADPNLARAAQALNGLFWALEVCDAVEADSYEIDGVKVSNFVLPPYFEPIQSLAGLRLDYMGLLTQPHEIRPGGYGQYFRSGRWHQIIHPSQAPRAYRANVPGRGAIRRARAAALEG